MKDTQKKYEGRIQEIGVTISLFALLAQKIASLAPRTASQTLYSSRQKHFSQFAMTRTGQLQLVKMVM